MQAEIGLDPKAQFQYYGAITTAFIFNFRQVHRKIMLYHKLYGQTQNSLESLSETPLMNINCSIVRNIFLNQNKIKPAVNNPPFFEETTSTNKKWEFLSGNYSENYNFK